MTAIWIGKLFFSCRRLSEFDVAYHAQLYSDYLITCIQLAFVHSQHVVRNLLRAVENCLPYEGACCALVARWLVCVGVIGPNWILAWIMLTINFELPFIVAWFCQLGSIDSKMPNSLDLSSSSRSSLSPLSILAAALLGGMRHAACGMGRGAINNAIGNPN